MEGRLKGFSKAGERARDNVSATEQAGAPVPTGKKTTASRSPSFRRVPLAEQIFKGVESEKKEHHVPK